jgi:Zn-dependent peptidase ImmA (M78 family)
MPSLSAELAVKVLRAHRMYSLPIDPFAIARKEGIVIKPGVYGDDFDARIEHYPALKAYCIFHAEPGGWRTEGRVRFSLAHELGHFYLPEHRVRLRNCQVHNSQTDFVSRDPHELEADEFAANLLMPLELFRAELKTFRGGFCTIQDMLKLANRLGTSVTSTARRYCESDGEACTIYFSEGGRVRWGKASEDMNRTGMYWYQYGTPAPDGSKTAEYWNQFYAGERPERLAGQVDADVWFSRPGAAVLWEEVMPLGNTGRVITQLTPHDA